jgi:glycosyltransferase involved in cell wall biosynthesis
MHVVIVRREPGIAFSMDVYADNLVTNLRDLHPEWEITEISPELWGEGENAWKSGTGLKKYYERFWRHPRSVKSLEGDIFHIIDHSNAHVAYWLKKHNCATVVTCHDLVQFVYPDILKDQSRFPALSMASWKYSVNGMRSADHIIAVSSNTAKDVVQMLRIPQNRVSAIANGVDEFFHPLHDSEIAEVRRMYEGEPGTFCLLNVGSTHQRKNIEGILKVLIRLRDKEISVKLWKVGGEFTAEQSNFIKAHKLAPLIAYIEKPNQELLVKLYNAADALLAPSLYEGFGLTILEAMACGIPVISSNISSIPEVAGNAAILLHPKDIEGITSAILNIQNDHNYRNELIAKGLKRAKLFTWDKTGYHISKIYESLQLRRHGSLNQAI